MTESDLRQLAELARRLLTTLVADPERARVIDAELSAALALPAGEGKGPLRRILTRRDPVLRAWFCEQAWVDDPDMGVTRARHLLATAPERVGTGRRLGVQVRIGEHARAGESVAPVSLDDVPPEGIDLVVDVASAGLTLEGDGSMPLHLPAVGDSATIRFGFIAAQPGQHEIRVWAFREGTSVAELTLSVAVDVGGVVATEQRVGGPVDLQRATPGHYTLLVRALADGRFTFALRGVDTRPAGSVERLLGDPKGSMGRLADVLRTQAEGWGQHDVANQRDDLRARAVSLWLDVIPEPIRAQFWDVRSKITLLSIASDWDHVPWELMYPRDDGRGDGYLVEQFPVVRQRPQQPYEGTIELTSAAYVTPHDAPAGADAEVQRIRDRLRTVRVDYGQVTTYQRFNELLHDLKTPPHLWHFACHNDFSEETGSGIVLADGHVLTPDHLGLARADHRVQSALVFLNACRSAGEFAGWRTVDSWATRFMEAGASAFIGSLWDVRSPSALLFADAFYGAFADDGLSLGEAVMRARQAIRSVDSDPTWLAYTVHGSPGLKAVAWPAA